MKKILVISNGHGEDSIAAELIRRLPADLVAEAYPTHGAGLAYHDVCPIVGPRNFIPSEGVRRRGSLLKDAISGLGIGATLRFLHSDAKKYDAVIVVGDFVGVAFAWLSGNRVRVYLDVYKSGYSNRYSVLEKFVMRRCCDLVLPRDPILATALSRSSVNSFFAGNVMMDTLSMGNYDARARRSHDLAIAILPGSRKDGAANFSLQMSALGLLDGPPHLDLFAVLAPGADPNEMAAAAGMRFVLNDGEDGDLGCLIGDNRIVHLSTGSLGNVLDTCDIVLGQAGTANMQALGLGKPVVSFLPPQARPRRVRRIADLVGESRIVVRQSAQDLADALRLLTTNAEERVRRGKVGRERIGPGGAIDAVIATLTR